MKDNTRAAPGNPASAAGGEFSATTSQAVPDGNDRIPAKRRSAPLWLLLTLMTLAVLTPLLALSGYSLFVRVQKERAAEFGRRKSSPVTWPDR